MNPNELFIEFGTVNQRKAFQIWLENQGFLSYLKSCEKMPAVKQPTCLTSNEFGEKDEHGTIEIE